MIFTGALLEHLICSGFLFSKRYKDSELNIGENSCIDRCVSKYWQVKDFQFHLILSKLSTFDSRTNRNAFVYHSLYVYHFMYSPLLFTR
ncbi:mitochondrial import inner membrane translocase subunit TIM10 [Olea europaea subsp. europaea]|uniref:Mitochondrial import inner membrane translocase subunit n=1 Tax=Olea europaea subsp. europaea TaxID=158383 RepID=A0A8S0SZ67_OLEEU|nr:mitochondrial import inner membrane translocase subunit TIM10 [Olea europaea subsp. europaea]